jgi:hypothetical protein
MRPLKPGSLYEAVGEKHAALSPFVRASGGMMLREELPSVLDANSAVRR